MVSLAELNSDPGPIAAWIAVGMFAGWLAGLVMSGGYGIVRDIVLGLIGSLVGGFVAGFFVQGAAGFWGSIVIAFLGACILIGIARAVMPGRQTRI